ncbi:hypothetical protein KUCAC02_035389, partial [Chaenocephalus aceratus]
TERSVPLQVLCVKNLSARASLAQLVALFSRYEQQSAPLLLYRLLTGRMKGQAFITLPGRPIKAYTQKAYVYVTAEL